MSAKASGTDAGKAFGTNAGKTSATNAGKPSGTNAANGDRSHAHNQGNQDRTYTTEQKAAVLRIRRCSPTAFYEILGLKEVRTSCSEGEIKKAYRKQSLLTHPDKNGHEHADEAFKMVSRAFGVLSDADKRKSYDRHGGDPDSKSGAAAAGSQFGGHGFGPRRRGWEENAMSPEEMFNQFFGGGMGGGPFGQFGRSRRQPPGAR
jgi:DnaJ family protein B protein 12